MKKLIYAGVAVLACFWASPQAKACPPGQAFLNADGMVSFVPAPAFGYGAFDPAVAVSHSFFGFSRPAFYGSSAFYGNPSFFGTNVFVGGPRLFGGFRSFGGGFHNVGFAREAAFGGGFHGGFRGAGFGGGGVAIATARGGLFGRRTATAIAGPGGVANASVGRRR